VPQITQRAAPTDRPLTPRHGQGVYVGRMESDAERPTCAEVCMGALGTSAWGGRSDFAD